MAPTIIEKKLRTYNREAPANSPWDWTRTNPWRAPGSAPVLDACGIASGSTKNNIAAGGLVPPGQRRGAKGSELPSHTSATWSIGSTQEVVFGITANHGGGYQYRLCPKSQALTEECFQKMPLALAGHTQRVRHDATGEEHEFTATVVSEGTVPTGSQWIMNPIPACSGPLGGDTPPCVGHQFEPPARGVVGFHDLSWLVVDRLQVPADIPPGEYVLGWRWDAEQTPQIWASCADIIIEETIASNRSLVNPGWFV